MIGTALRPLFHSALPEGLVPAEDNLFTEADSCYSGSLRSLCHSEEQSKQFHLTGLGIRSHDIY